LIVRWGVDADPTAQGRIKGAKPVAVLDIGSNSVRLVVYERHARALTPLYNEKASCALGRGVAATGRLADANVAHALQAMRRFALVAKLMGVGRTHILATSAVREAANGAEFSAEVEAIMGAPAKVLSGVEEAHFAALGVAAGIPGFTGVVGDLGGGSLELSRVEDGKDFEGETHELGVIRLQDDSDGSAVKSAEITRERLKDSTLLRAGKYGTFCAIGGTWRSLVKLHQKHNKYPLHMIQHYTAKAADIIDLCDAITADFEQTGTYQNEGHLSSSRRGLMPFGAAIMAETLRAGEFDNVVFSALGVREGYLFELLKPKEQAVDPLLQACEEMSVLRSRSPAHAYDLIEFTAQFLEGTGLKETEAEQRLRQALCYLADIGWRGHPDYRGDQSVDLVAYGALVGIDHPGRAFLAEVLAVRYMGLKHKSVSSALLKLAGSDGHKRARIMGALLRVAYPMSAGMPGVLPRVRFSKDAEMLILHLPQDFEFLGGERLENRLSQLASTLDLKNTRITID